MYRLVLIVASLFLSHTQECRPNFGDQCVDDIPYLECKLREVKPELIVKHVRCQQFVDKGYCRSDPTIYGYCCEACEASGYPRPSSFNGTCQDRNGEIDIWIRGRKNDCHTAYDIFQCKGIMAATTLVRDVLSVGCRKSWPELCRGTIRQKELPKWKNCPKLLRSLRAADEEEDHSL